MSATQRKLSTAIGPLARPCSGRYAHDDTATSVTHARARCSRMPTLRWCASALAAPRGPEQQEHRAAHQHQVGHEREHELRRDRRDRGVHQRPASADARRHVAPRVCTVRHEASSAAASMRRSTGAG